jgi:hypothetical protein
VRENYAVFYFAGKRFFFYIYEFFTSPGKRKRPTIHYSPRIPRLVRRSYPQWGALASHVNVALDTVKEKLDKYQNDYNERHFFFSPAVMTSLGRIWRMAALQRVTRRSRGLPERVVMS